MLDREQSLNFDRLRESRGDTTAFFVFADTVSARNFKGTNECHGWMGVKYQTQPRDDDSQIILHVRMKDRENALQPDPRFAHAAQAALQRIPAPMAR